MNKELLAQSISIFDTQDKWDALFELHNQSNRIIEHWLTIGAIALRESFADHSQWGCEKWGSHLWDTRWYLKDFGEKSVAIGFGWGGVDLHLHLTDTPTDVDTRAAELISSSTFKPLLEILELTASTKYIYDGSLAYNSTINPFSGVTDAPVRQRELAWKAAHETEEYVRKMGGIIRRLTDDAGHTALFREFNREISEYASALQVAQP